MSTKISKINMNKVIVLFASFFVLITLTIIINSFTKYDDNKNISNNKNEYASSNKVVVEEKEEQTIIVKEEAVQQEDIIIYENIPVQQEEINQIPTTNDINNNTILYFEQTEEEINLLVDTEDEKLSVKAKQKIVELIDFIFYGTEINGVTFDQLTEETKQKLINIVNRIDLKIEEKIPGYKETISTNAKYTYAFLIEKLNKGIDYLDEKAEEKIGTEKYEEIKENINETTERVKDSGSVVIEKGKELLGTAKDKIKNWYEGWK